MIRSYRPASVAAIADASWRSVAVEPNDAKQDGIDERERLVRVAMADAVTQDQQRRDQP